VADRVTDGRTKRKYDNISRRDYRVIVAALGKDGGFSEEVRESLTTAFDQWRTYRNGRTPVPSDLVLQLEKLAEKHRVTHASPVPWAPNRAE
jgi:hypothetical protein